MTTFNTGNPLGSTAVKDLYDNAENLDYATNDRTTRTWEDRLGVARRTWYGMEQDFQEFLLRSGYVGTGPDGEIEDYVAGIDLVAYNQVFRYDGDLYRAGPGLDLPYTTTGDWEEEGGSFVAVGDGSLRQDLISPEGASLIGAETPAGTTLENALAASVYQAASYGGLSLLEDSFLPVGGVVSAGEAPFEWTGSAFKPMGLLRVESFLPDHSTHQEAIEACMSVATDFPGQTITCETSLTLERIVLPTKTKFVGKGRPTLDFTGRSGVSTNDDPFILVRGAEQKETVTTANVSFQETHLTLSDASDFMPGSLILVWNETSGTGQNIWSDSSISVRIGELSVLTGANQSTGLVSLLEPIMEESGYLVSDNTRVKLISPAEDVEISGFNIIGKGRQAAGLGDYGVVVFYGKNCRVIGNTFDGVDGRAIHFISCYNYEAAHNHVTTGQQGSNTTVNYGIVPCAASKYGKIHGNSGGLYRHFIVTSHLSISDASFSPGVVRFLDVYNNQISRTWHAAIATHNDVEHLNIFNNTVGFSSPGINVRERNTNVYKNTIIGCNQGIYFSGHPKNIIVDSNVIDHSSGNGVYAAAMSDARNVQNITITNNRISNCVNSGIALQLNSAVTNSNFVISGNVITNISGPGGNAATIRVQLAPVSDLVITNNTIMDGTNTQGIAVNAGASRMIVEGNKVLNVSGNSYAFQGSYSTAYCKGNYGNNIVGGSSLTNSSTIEADNTLF